MLVWDWDDLSVEHLDVLGTVQPAIDPNQFKNTPDGSNKSERHCFLRVCGPADKPDALIDISLGLGDVAVNCDSCSPSSFFVCEDNCFFTAASSSALSGIQHHFAIGHPFRVMLLCKALDTFLGPGFHLQVHLDEPGH